MTADELSWLNGSSSDAQMSEPAVAVRGPEAVSGTGGLDLAGLFRQHHADLVRLAALLVRSQETAEDIVQDVFTRIHARPGRQPDLDGALAYVRQSVVNGCRSWQRRQASARRLGAELDRSPAGLHESAEHEAIRAEARRRVLTELAALPQRRREVLVLRYYLGLSEAEIARTVGISQGTVKSTAARGLAALAKALGKDS